MLIDNLHYKESAVKYAEKCGVPLGNNYEIKFHVPADVKKITNYFKQDCLAEILPNERVSFCMRSIVPTRLGVEVWHNKEFMSAHYGNLMTCGSIWLCPVCASKISERRKNELVKGFENWRGGLVMITLTLSHKSNESLSEILKKLDRSYKLLTHGRKWQELKNRFKIRGSVSNMEITFGSNGWHPHKHIVFLVDNEFVYKSMGEVLTNKWLGHLKSSGASGLKGIALKVDPVLNMRSKVAEYIAEYNKQPQKIWSIETELTKSYIKSSQNFWSIVDDFINYGSLKSLGLILEYASATKGRRSVVFSRGLRKLLDIDDKTDLELATEKDKNAELLALIARDIWKVVTRNKKRGELLKIASSGNPEELEEYINNLIEVV